MTQLHRISCFELQMREVHTCKGLGAALVGGAVLFVGTGRVAADTTASRTRAVARIPLGLLLSSTGSVIVYIDHGFQLFDLVQNMSNLQA